jgi:hypothetical protein
MMITFTKSSQSINCVSCFKLADVSGTISVPIIKSCYGTGSTMVNVTTLNMDFFIKDATEIRLRVQGLSICQPNIQ